MNPRIFTFGLVGERHVVVGEILIQMKLNGMLESLGEEDKEGEATDICQPNLPLESSVSFCSWIETISGYLPWANSKQLQKCFSTKCFHLGKGSSSCEDPLERPTGGKGDICYPVRKQPQNLQQSVSWSNLFLGASCLH